MKSLQKRLAPLLVLVALVTVAFAARNMRTETPDQPAKALTTTAYFRLPSALVADENDPSKWVFADLTEQPDDCEDGEDVLCSINAPAIQSNGTWVIDVSQLTLPINMQTDPKVSDQQFQREAED